MSNNAQNSNSAVKESVKTTNAVKFTVTLVLPITGGSMLGKSKTAHLSDDLKLARFYLNAVLRYGKSNAVLVSEESVSI
jgi:hypothetical protein